LLGHTMHEGLDIQFVCLVVLIRRIVFHLWQILSLYDVWSWNLLPLFQVLRSWWELC
jgi:hypothetical protein